MAQIQDLAENLQQTTENENRGILLENQFITRNPNNRALVDGARGRIAEAQERIRAAKTDHDNRRRQIELEIETMRRSADNYVSLENREEAKKLSEERANFEVLQKGEREKNIRKQEERRWGRVARGGGAIPPQQPGGPPQGGGGAPPAPGNNP